MKKIIPSIRHIKLSVWRTQPYFLSESDFSILFFVSKRTQPQHIIFCYVADHCHSFKLQCEIMVEHENLKAFHVACMGPSLLCNWVFIHILSLFYTVHVFHQFLT